MSDNRAQTTLDFAIAMGVFLVSVIFVFAFAPTLTAPFVDGTQDHSAAADRVVSDLSEGELGDPAEPYVLDTDQTDFFDNDPAELREAVGVRDRIDVAVRIERRDSGTAAVVHFDSGTLNTDENGTPYRVQTGDPAGAGGSVTAARRIVTFDTEDCEFTGSNEACDVVLFVEVW
ncbi:MAG: hypothetical protein PPP58_08330 [Natronomonas sp.]